MTDLIWCCFEYFYDILGFSFPFDLIGHFLTAHSMVWIICYGLV